MLTKKKIVCPENLLKIAKTKGPINAVIVNAGKSVSIESAKLAVEEGLINPVFVGDKITIEKLAKDIKWNISKYQIIVKGHIHTDILMKAVLKRDLNLIGKKRLSHVWHMTLGENDKAFIITDGALNVLPKLETKMHILKNSVEFAKRIGINNPKVSVLSATEEVLDSMPSSKEAKELTERALKDGVKAEVFGPMAFDNSVSEKAAQIKGIKNAVAGNTDILLVPNVETGNALVKMMIYFMGACAAGVVIGGKVPVVITSRADDTQARLASIAAAIVAL